jgi:hypothetical protein
MHCVRPHVHRVGALEQGVGSRGRRVRGGPRERAYEQTARVRPLRRGWVHLLIVWPRERRLVCRPALGVASR